MDVSSTHVPGTDAGVLRDVLALAVSEQPAPAPGDAPALLERMLRLFDCDRVVLRTLDDSDTTAVFTAGREPAGSYPVGVDDPGTQWLTDRLTLGWPSGGDHAVEVELLRLDGTAFGRCERILFDLLEPQLTAWLIGTARPRTQGLQHRLTTRQVEVLRLAQLGLTNREIGRGLGVSEATVCKHLANINERLGVLSRTAAVAAAFGTEPSPDPEGPDGV
jgi:DNA-binding CsgD family transcriptional regulator